MMKLQTSRIHIPRPKKRFVIIAIAAIFVAALGVYGFLSYTTWRDLDQESKQVSSSLKTAFNEALGAKKDTISPTTEMKTLISDFNKKYSETPCTVSVFMNWQTIIPQVKTISSDCENRFSNALAAITSLEPLISFIEHEEKANTLLAASTEATKAPTDYAAASTTWKTTAESSDLANTETFQAVADAIKTVSAGISTAYSSLDTAMKNEDKAALDTAIEGLQAAYAATASIATLSASERQVLVLVIADAYDAL